MAEGKQIDDRMDVVWMMLTGADGKTYFGPLKRTKSMMALGKEPNQLICAGSLKRTKSAYNLVL